MPDIRFCSFVRVRRQAYRHTGIHGGFGSSQPLLRAKRAFEAVHAGSFSWFCTIWFQDGTGYFACFGRHWCVQLCSIIRCVHPSMIRFVHPCLLRCKLCVCVLRSCVRLCVSAVLHLCVSAQRVRVPVCACLRVCAMYASAMCNVGVLPPEACVGESFALGRRRPCPSAQSGFRVMVRVCSEAVKTVCDRSFALQLQRRTTA